MNHLSAKPKTINRITATLIAVTFSFLAVFLILTISPNYNSAAFFHGFFVNLFQDSARVKEVLLQFAAFLIGSLAVLLCYRINFINLNVAGQMAASALVIYIVGHNLNMAAEGSEPTNGSYWFMPIVLLAGILTSVLMSLFIATIRLYYGVNEVLSGIFLNLIVYHVFRAVVRYSNWTSQLDTYNEMQHSLNATAKMNFTWEVISLSLILAIAIFTFMLFIFQRTQIGFKLKVIGRFRAASQYAGIKSTRVILGTFAVAGLLAGLAGAFYYYRDPDNTTLSANEALPANGFDTLTIVWLAQTSIFFLPVTTLFIAWIRTQQTMISISEVDPQIVNLLVGLSLLGIAFVNQYYSVPETRARVHNLISNARHRLANQRNNWMLKKERKAKK